MRLTNQVRAKFGEDLLERSLTVCSGLDMVNISLCHLVFPSKKETEVRPKKEKLNQKKCFS